MASRTQQKIKATHDKRRGQVRLQRSLVPWIKEIVTNYRIGDIITTPTAIPILSGTLRTNYISMSTDVLTFDIREHKQIDDDTNKLIFESIALQLEQQFVNREPRVTRSVSSTANKSTARTTQLAIANEWTQKEADTALTNYLKNQRLTIAVTESNWTVETTRRIAVVSVQDPLNNSVEQMVNLMRRGEFNEAVKLSRKVKKLAKLPTSVNQGKLIRLISGIPENARVVSPVTQAEAIFNVQRQAEALDSTGKMWETLGDGKVRASHEAANGQIQENVEAPFILDGGALQYPGDSSLGADVAEVINCRCVSTYL